MEPTITITRTQFGKFVSEGQRRLWLALVLNHGSVSNMARALGTSSGLLVKWLYADQSPGTRTLPKLDDVRAEDFSRPPCGPFPLDKLQAMYEAWKANQEAA